MNDVTHLLQQLQAGKVQAQDELFNVVYQELRQIAAAQMNREQPGHTLQPTALVHEAWLRLIRPSTTTNPLLSLLPGEEQGERRRYFFAAAAEAMRRILIEQARRKKAEIHGGNAQRVDLDPELLVRAERTDDLLAVSEALDRLHVHDAQVAELVKLRYFVGMTIPEVAQAMDISPRTADAWWAYARAWLREALEKEK